MSALAQPKDALIVPNGDFHFTDYGRELLRAVGPPDGVTDAAKFYMSLELAGLSKEKAVAVLEHLAGKATDSIVTPGYLALCTTVPTASSTGATIVEPTYTGYARKKVEGADWAAAVEGSPSSIANGNQLVFAACTAGTSTVVAWAYCTASGTGAGKVIVWGTATSTVISTTQTPATVAVGLLQMTAQ